MVDAGSMTVLDDLLASEELRDVAIGLAALEASGRPEYVQRLGELARSDRPTVATLAMERLRTADPERAVEVAHDVAVTSADPATVASALAVLAEGPRGPHAAGAAMAVLGSDDERVRAAAAAVVVRHGSPEALAALARAALAAATDAHADARGAAAAILAGAPTLSDDDGVALLVRLLDDPDPGVVTAALAAVGRGAPPSVVRRAAELLGERPHAAAEALARVGADALGVCEEVLATAVAVLADDDHADMPRQRLDAVVSAVRRIGGPPAAQLLARHSGCTHLDARSSILSALASLAQPVAVLGPGWSADPLIDAELELAATTRHLRTVVGAGRIPDPARIPGDGRALDAMVVDESTGDPIGDSIDDAMRGSMRDSMRDSTGLALDRALADELDLARARLLALLAVRHGADATDRLVFQLSRSDPRPRAMALEWLEVALGSRARRGGELIDRVPALRGIGPIGRWRACPTPSGNGCCSSSSGTPSGSGADRGCGRAPWPRTWAPPGRTT